VTKPAAVVRPAVVKPVAAAPVQVASPAPATLVAADAGAVSDALREQLSIVLGLSPEKVTESWSEPLSDVGLDSLGAMELRAWMQKSGFWDPSALTPSLLVNPTTSCESLVELASGAGAFGSFAASSSATAAPVQKALAVAKPLAPKAVASPVARPVAITKPAAVSAVSAVVRPAVVKPAAVAAVAAPVQSAPAAPAISADAGAVSDALREQLSVVLGMSPEKVTESWSEPLSDVGLDSLGAMELRAWMQKSGFWDAGVLTPTLLVNPTTSCQSLVELSQVCFLFVCRLQVCHLTIFFCCLFISALTWQLRSCLCRGSQVSGCQAGCCRCQVSGQADPGRSPSGS
jgi:aryl carrier-like protein